MTRRIPWRNLTVGTIIDPETGRQTLKMEEVFKLSDSREKPHTTLKVVLRFASGDRSEIELSCGDDGDVLAAVELHANEQPVFIVPVAIHDDSRRLHTICQRNTPEVGAVDW